LRGRGIYLRNGDMDIAATMRQAELLFHRRPEGAGAEPTSWSRVLNDVFGYESQYSADMPIALMVGVTPAYPIDPIAIDDETDWEFRRLYFSLLQTQQEPLTEPHGVIYAPFLYDSATKDASFACAYDDGSAGFRLNLSKGLRAESDVLDLNDAARKLWHALSVIPGWPRESCKYRGSLLCRIAVGNLENVYATIPYPGSQPEVPPIRNRLLGWAIETELDATTDLDGLIDRALASLARQLQFRRYRDLQWNIFDALDHFRRGW
jgi:hypothetical protein